MNSGEPITLRQLEFAMRRNIAWMRIYPPHGQKQMDLMSRDAIRDAVLAYGDCTVREAMPGMGYVMVWLD